MGIDQQRAETALRETSNNVDEATMWLTADRQGNDVNSETFSSTEPSGPDTGTQATNIRDDIEASGSIHDRSKRARISKEEEEAELMAEDELKKSLQEHDLQKEYFGSKLDEEFQYLQKFRGQPP